MTIEYNTLESGVPLSQSLLWKLQRVIFDKFGVEAWTKKGVPSYITANPLTTHKYAQLVLGFLRDSAKMEKGIDESQPIYIFDLGAGTGRFAYGFLRALLSLTSSLPQFKKLQFRYVITDIIPKNLSFCRQHRQLQHYFELGILDIALYDHAQTEPIQLQLSGEILKQGTLANPAIIIANYFFDSIPKDLFYYSQGKLYEGMISIKTPLEQFQEALLEDPELLQKLSYHFEYHHCSDPYPKDQTLRYLLEEYSTKLVSAPFTVPVGAITSIRYFQALTHNRLLTIGGDQGYATLAQIRRAGEPKLSLHGSFSIPVNYDLIASYFTLQKAHSWLSNDSSPLFQVFCGAFGNSEFPETALAYKEHIEAFEPKDYWRLATDIEDKRELPSLGLLLVTLKLGYWDPMNFHAFFNAIHEQLPDASLELKEQLRHAIHSLWEGFYPIQPLEGAFVMNLAVLLFKMQHYSEALSFFQHSMDITGENSTVYQNMAACYLALFNQEAAARCSDKARQLAELESKNKKPGTSSSSKFHVELDETL